MTNNNQPKIFTSRKGDLIVKWFNQNDYRAICAMSSALRAINENCAIVINNKEKFTQEFNTRFFKA